VGDGPHETVEAHTIHEEVVESQFDNDVLDIFEEFKKGLEKEVEAGDSETHYNLGIAYREMGLLDDAIKEFQTSRNDPECSVRSMTMLGICYMEKGLYPLAIDAFKGARDGIATRDESYWGAQYDLASAYEKNGDSKEAFEIFSEIYGWNSQFRQVTERLNHLKTVLSKEDTAAKQKEKKDRVSYI
jgi:tetratricopeptide (TPR) repeat protein